MTKKTFLKRLETKLESLEENRRSEILKKYELIIDNEKKEGKVEKDIIAALGDVDLIAKIYINETVEKDEPKKADESKKEEKVNDDDSTVTKAINGVIKFFDDAFEHLDEKVAKRVLLLFCFIAIGLAVISLLHIPFRLIEILGIGIFRIAFSDTYFYNVISIMWSICINVSYIVFIIWLAVHYINQIVMKYSGAEKAKPKTAKKSTTNKEEIKHESKAVQNNAVFDVAYILIKVFIVILTLPFLTAVAGLFIALFFILFLIFNGVTMYGLALLILGLLIMLINLLDLIYTSLFKGGLK